MAKCTTHNLAKEACIVLEDFFKLLVFKKETLNILLSLNCTNELFWLFYHKIKRALNDFNLLQVQIHE